MNPEGVPTRGRSPEAIRRSLAAHRAATAAPLLAVAALCAAAHGFVVQRGFVPVRAAAALDASTMVQGAVLVPLPRVPGLAGHVPVIALEAENRTAAPLTLRLSVGGLPQGEAVLDAGARRRIHRTMTDGFGRLIAAAPAGTIGVRLAGDADGWVLRSLVISNARARVGEPGWLFVVPSSAGGFDRPARGASAALFGAWAVLVLLAMRIGAGPGRFTPGAIAVGLLWTAALLLPAATGQRVLVSPLVFHAVSAVAFAGPLLALGAATRRTLGRLLKRTVAIAARLAVRGSSAAAPIAAVWRRQRSILEPALGLFGLVSLAIAYPLFEVVSKSPEFFVARNTSRAVAVGTVAAICWLLPLALVLLHTAARRVSRVAALVLQGTFIATLVALLAAPWLGRTVLPDAAVLWTAGGAGLAMAVLAWRSATVRSFLTALGPAALVVPAVFLLDADVRGALVPGSGAAGGAAPQRTPPIVFVVFDEFPLNSLLDGDRLVDAGRFPNFAALARDGYWYRNASAVSSDTMWSVPAIVSGLYPVTPRAVPTLRYYPDNLFTLLQGHYEMHVFGRFLQLCPESVCHYDSAVPPDSVRSLLGDLSIVYLHIVLPQTLRRSLPPIVGDWRGFAGQRMRAASGPERVLRDRLAEFDRFIDAIDDRPGRLYFLHSLLPHMPFGYVPSGRQYEAPDYQATEEQRRPLFEKASAEYADALHQRHLLQVGFVDHLVGRLRTRLQSLGIYDDALIVITADHGASYREGRRRRQARADNAADVLLVPLFVKVPGQRRGGIVDRNVENIDILPTIADVLSMDLHVRIDGRSLLDSGRPERPAKTFVVRNLARSWMREVKDWQVLAQASLTRKLARFGSGDAQGLFSTPATRGMPGTAVSGYKVVGGSSVRAVIARRRQFDAVDSSATHLPLHVSGRLENAPDEPLTLAVALNGVIAATTVSYRADGRHVFATMIPEHALAPGANRVAVFIVRAKPGGIVLTRIGAHGGRRAAPRAAERPTT